MFRTAAPCSYLKQRHLDGERKGCGHVRDDAVAGGRPRRRHGRAEVADDSPTRRAAEDASARGRREVRSGLGVSVGSARRGRRYQLTGCRVRERAGGRGGRGEHSREIWGIEAGSQFLAPYRWCPIGYQCADTVRC